jgi:hypothetical protein
VVQPLLRAKMMKKKKKKKEKRKKEEVRVWPWGLPNHPP